MMWENGRISSDGDPNAPPTFTHGRTFSNVSRGSGLRNEVKFADNDPDAHGEDVNDTSKDAFMDAPLYAHGSPTKNSGHQQQYQQQQPQVYSHQHNSSRSNLAPVNSNPAYQHGNQQQRSRTDPQYGRYDAPVADEYADYYSSR